MKNNRRLLKAAVILLMAGIVGQFAIHNMTQKKNMPMMRDMGRMFKSRMPPGINPEQLPEPESAGARLLGRYCSQCHGVPGPGIHTADEWPVVVARMNRRMQMMSGGRMMMSIEAPDDRELKILMTYLEKNSQQTIDASKLAGANTPNGKAFKKICSQCHALPDPAQHTGSEWPAVVRRMRVNMSTLGKELPDQATTDMILNFLQEHAAK